MPRLGTTLLVCVGFIGCAHTPDSSTELPIECGGIDVTVSIEPRRWAEQAAPVLIAGGTVLTAVGDTFAPGYVLFADGEIQAVGPGEPEVVSTDTVRIDASGRWVTPGIIDSHSHLGVYPTPYVDAHADGNEATSPTTAEVEAVDSVWPEDPGFERAIAGGVTAMQILPGSANLIGGRGFVMRNRPGARSAEDLRLAGAPETIKMACGENPKRVYGERGTMPSTRMGNIAVLRQTWLDARRYADAQQDHAQAMQRWCDSGADPASRPTAPATDLANETLAGVLRGETLVQIHCYRADDMLAQIALADEFGYRIRGFHHAVEAYKIRDVLVDRQISVSTWADWWGFKLEALDAIPETVALLHESGAMPVVHSDSAVGIQRLNQEAAKAYAAGLAIGIELDDDDAIRWITYNPAWTLGIEDQTGSLQPGLEADIVVWSGSPFSMYTSADRVFSQGVEVYDRADHAAPWSDFELGLWPHLRAR